MLQTESGDLSGKPRGGTQAAECPAGGIDRVDPHHSLSAVPSPHDHQREAFIHEGFHRRDCLPGRESGIFRPLHRLRNGFRGGASRVQPVDISGRIHVAALPRGKLRAEIIANDLAYNREIKGIDSFGGLRQIGGRGVDICKEALAIVSFHHRQKMARLAAARHKLEVGSHARGIEGAPGREDLSHRAGMGRAVQEHGDGIRNAHEAAALPVEKPYAVVAFPGRKDVGREVVGVDIGILRSPDCGPQYEFAVLAPVDFAPVDDIDVLSARTRGAGSPPGAPGRASRHKRAAH